MNEKNYISGSQLDFLQFEINQLYMSWPRVLQIHQCDEALITQFKYNQHWKQSNNNNQTTIKEEATPWTCDECATFYCVSCQSHHPTYTLFQWRTRLTSTLLSLAMSINRLFVGFSLVRRSVWLRGWHNKAEKVTLTTPIIHKEKTRRKWNERKWSNEEKENVNTFKLQ